MDPTTDRPTVTFHVHNMVGGHPLDGEYVEQFWLNAIGPTPLLLARFALRHRNERWVLPEVAACLGVKSRVVLHAGTRLHRYTLAAFANEADTGPADWHLTVRSAVRDYPMPERLPEALRYLLTVNA